MTRLVLAAALVATVFPAAALESPQDMLRPPLTEAERAKMNADQAEDWKKAMEKMAADARKVKETAHRPKPLIDPIGLGSLPQSSDVLCLPPFPHLMQGEGGWTEMAATVLHSDGTSATSAVGSFGLQNAHLKFEPVEKVTGWEPSMTKARLSSKVVMSGQILLQSPRISFEKCSVTFSQKVDAKTRSAECRLTGRDKRTRRQTMSCRVTQTSSTSTRPDWILAADYVAND